MRIRTLATVSAVATGLVLVLAACSPPSKPDPSHGGPFRLEGNVYDGDFWLPGVEVSVTEGVGQGLVTQTKAAGIFTLDGVQGQIQVRLRKQGYPDHIEQVNVTGNTRRPFYLGRNVARPDYTGTYALTISAAASCTTPIPQRRTYGATIARHYPDDTSRIDIRLSGADFVTTPDGPANQFTGNVDPSGAITFSLGISDIYYEWHVYDVEERLATGTLAINGMATTTGSPERISGALAGTLRIVEEGERSPLAECRSDAHALEMVRR